MALDQRTQSANINSKEDFDNICLKTSLSRYLSGPPRLHPREYTVELLGRGTRHEKNSSMYSDCVGSAASVGRLKHGN